MLDEWYSYFHQCSQCRRCSAYCPFGIDTAEISMAAREIMDSIGMGQKYTNEIIAKVHKVGNNLGLPPKALKNTLESLEEEIEEETGVPVKLPLDHEGAEILLVTPSADFFASPHMEGLIGYAKVLHEAGISWTFSSTASEAGNFGMFIGSYENMHKISSRVGQAVRDLKVKRLMFGECGHAWRVAYNFLNTLAGPFDTLDKRYPVPQHICEFTYDLIQKGKLSSTSRRTTTSGSPSTIAAMWRAPPAWGTRPAGSSKCRARSCGRPATTISTWTRRRSARARSAAAVAAAC